MHTQERVASTLQNEAPVHERLAQDLMTTMLFNALSMEFLKFIVGYQSILPDEIGTKAAKAYNSLMDLEKSIKNKSNGKREFINMALNNEVLIDAATIIQTVSKINAELDQEEYAEMFNLITETMTAVLYAQTNKKKLHFGKYKALLKLISQEIVADTNRTPSQFVYRITHKGKGELFIRTAAPEIKPQIEE